MARVFSTNPQKNFFEDRDDRELSVKARLKAGHDACSRRGASSRCSRRTSSASIRQLNRDRGAAVRTQFEMRTRGDDGELEIQRDLRGPGAGGAAGGVHQRRRPSLEPRPHAHARNRRPAGDGRRAFPARPAAADRKPDARVPRWIGRRSPSATAASVPRHVQHSDRACRSTIPFRMDTRVLLASLALSVVERARCAAWRRRCRARARTW